MRAILVHDTHATIGVAKHDQVLAEQTGPDRRAVGLADFFEQTHWRPVTAQHLAHRCVAFDAAEQQVLFWGQHVISPAFN
ncbi:hypothetical protein D3C76_1462800 [compost metagenome]